MFEYAEITYKIQNDSMGRATGLSAGVKIYEIDVDTLEEALDVADKIDKKNAERRKTG